MKVMESWHAKSSGSRTNRDLDGRNVVRILATALVVGVMLVGCGAVPRDAGFSQVQQLVAKHGDQRIQWNRGGPEDRAITAEIHGLLEEELTVDSAVQIALLNNPELQATYEELGLAQAELVQAGLLRNPTFDGSIRFGSAGTGIDLSLVQNFLSVLQIPLRKRLANTVFESAKNRVAGAVIDLAGQTRQAFYDMQAVSQELEMRKTIVQALSASYEIAKRLYAAGNIADLELSNERMLYEQAKLDLRETETRSIGSREQLNSVMGLWGSAAANWTFAPRLPALPEEEVSLENLESIAVERNFEVAARRAEVVLAQHRLRSTRPLLVSEGEAGVSAERDPEGEWGLGPTLSIPIPIFDQGRPAVAAAAANLRRAQQLHAAAAIAVRSEIRAIRARLLAARDRVAHFHQVILPLGRTVTDQTQKQFNAMQVSAFQLLDAKQREISAGVHFVDALREYWSARVDLDVVLDGGRSPLVQHQLADE